ncbi:MAG TPA: ATP-binding protein, partial [Bacteroidales bacterium]|nr:ATP-binding protein [Bacteroidales bacterium]
ISKYPDKGEQKVKEVIQKGEIKNFEATQYTKSGKALYLELSAKMIEYNRKPAILSLNHDITKRKKQEKIQQLLLNISEKSVKDISLREYISIIHKELKSIIKADNFYIALYHKDTGKYSFPYYEDETDDFEGDEQEDLSNTLTNYIRKTKKGKLITEETEELIKQEENIKLIGEPSPVWLGVPLIDSETEDVIGVLALQDYHDKDAYSHDDLLTLEIISNHIGLFIERVKYFEQLKIAKELAESSDHLKSAFLANMSHEIRTPMNGIIGFTDLLLEPEFSGKEKQNFIEAIQKSGNRMLNTVNDIIEISKIETGEVQVKTKEFNLNEKVRELIQFFIPEAEKKSLILSYKTPLPDEETSIYCDESKLESVITNLVKNAIKYSDKGEISFGYKPENERLLFYCKDEGIGIPENRIEAIFNRFEQADIADSRAFQGSGLGLAISKSYVEMLDGKIWVESVYGEGSTFYFTFPFIKAPQNAAQGDEIASTPSKTAPSKKLNILIAEDDENSIEYLRIALKDIAKSLAEVYTGRDAIEYCKNHPETDLVLMDIQLPALNGYEATKQIRSFNDEVTIIAQTAYALEGDDKKALNSGCDGYIAKPINRKKLLNLIEKKS